MTRWTDKVARRIAGIRSQPQTPQPATSRESMREREPDSRTEHALRVHQWEERAQAETARREAAFAAGAPARRAGRQARLEAWAQDQGKTEAEFEAARELHTQVEEAMTRRQMDLPPRNDVERKLFREWAELDAEVREEAQQAAQDEIEADYNFDRNYPEAEEEPEADLEAGL